MTNSELYLLSSRVLEYISRTDWRYLVSSVNVDISGSDIILNIDSYNMKISLLNRDGKVIKMFYDKLYMFYSNVNIVEIDGLFESVMIFNRDIKLDELGIKE